MRLFMPNTCGILLTEAFKSRRIRRKQHKTKHSGRIEYYEKNKTNYSGGSCGNAAYIKPFFRICGTADQNGDLFRKFGGRNGCADTDPPARAGLPLV